MAREGAEESSEIDAEKKKEGEKKHFLLSSSPLPPLLFLSSNKMYNGIGLQTVRGSGTSGHVQANKFAVRNRANGNGNRNDGGNGKPSSSRPNKQPNAAILEHNRLREIEFKLAELEDELEEQG